jgi:uncharacterized protein YjbI with pentapeptide repeats
VANEEHLANLKAGIENWKQWKKANEDIRPDLSNADLSRENIKGADLSKGNNFCDSWGTI